MRKDICFYIYNLFYFAPTPTFSRWTPRGETNTLTIWCAYIIPTDCILQLSGLRFLCFVLAKVITSLRSLLQRSKAPQPVSRVIYVYLYGVEWPSAHITNIINFSIHPMVVFVIYYYYITFINRDKMRNVTLKVLTKNSPFPIYFNKCYNLIE